MARFLRRFQRRNARFVPAEDWPIDAGVQLLLDADGGNHVELDDDCPICRRLREAGEPIFTLDPLGNLVLVGND